MGKLVVTEFVSIDGVFEDPGGAENYEHGGWTFEYDRGEDGNQFKLDELMEAEVQLLGRVTYEGFAAAWPSREGRLDHADGSRVGEYDGHIRRRRRGHLEAEGRDGRRHPRGGQRHARRDPARG